MTTTTGKRLSSSAIALHRAIITLIENSPRHTEYATAAEYGLAYAAHVEALAAVQAAYNAITATVLGDTALAERCPNRPGKIRVDDRRILGELPTNDWRRALPGFIEQPA